MVSPVILKVVHLLRKKSDGELNKVLIIAFILLTNSQLLLSQLQHLTPGSPTLIKLL